MRTVPSFCRLLAQAALAASLALGLSACDSHRAEREQARAEQAQREAEQAQLRRQLELAQAELAQTERALAEQQAQRAELAQAQAQRDARLATYLAEHKAATLALVATGAAAVTALDDEARQALQRELGAEAPGVAVAAGLMGAGYCAFNFEECAAVGSTLTGYGMERKAHVERLQQVDALLQQLAQARERQQQAVQAVGSQVQAGAGWPGNA